MSPWRALTVSACLLVCASCERCSCDPPSSTSSRPVDNTASRVRVGGADKQTVAIPIAKANLARRGDGGDLTLVGRANEPGLWTSGVTLDVALNTLEPGPLSPILQGATCNVRFLRAGVQNEAEMTLMKLDGKLEELGQGAYDVSLSATCTKRVTETVGGAPHADEVPKSVTVETDLRVQLR